MGIWKTRQVEGNIVFKLRLTFVVFTTTLLSFLLPLSFLLLARISTLHYLLQALTISSTDPVLSFLQITNPINPLYPLVSAISVAALIHAFTTSHIAFSRYLHNSSPPKAPVLRCPSLYVSWIFLCTLQVFVGLGVEGSIVAGTDGSGILADDYGGIRLSLLSRVVFFLGLHETTVYWSRAVVKPVVDDAVFGADDGHDQVEERLEGKVAVAVAVTTGCLWWWKLREEVEALVAVPQLKTKMGMSVGVADFFGWWLYYLIVAIGMVKVVKGLIWFGLILLCRRVDERNLDEHSLSVENKV